MRFPMFADFCCCAVCFTLALSCPLSKPQHKDGEPYLGSCTNLGLHSEQWTIKLDIALSPGEVYFAYTKFSNNLQFTLPTPEHGFWLKSAHVAVTDRAEAKRFMWPPVHVHHINCRTLRADVWYEQDLYEHLEGFILMAGNSHVNKQLEQYDILNASDGFGSYYPAGTKLTCGLRVDDDRLYGKQIQYRFLIMLHVINDANKSFDFQPRNVIVWEGTTTGHIAYNLPVGRTRILSKEYHAPRAGAFQPDSFDVHTHPGAKSMTLFAKRLGGQDLIKPELLFTLWLPNMTVKPGNESQNLNVKPGVYMQKPIIMWSKVGFDWLNGKLNTSGVGSSRSCAFQEGDIFYTKSIHVASTPTIKSMMVLFAVVHWSEPPLQTTAVFTGRNRHYGGVLRNQLFDIYNVPHDLLAEVPQRVNKSSLYELHRRMPLLFGDPGQVDNFKYLNCIRTVNKEELEILYSVKDLDTEKLAIKQRPCWAHGGDPR